MIGRQDLSSALASLSLARNYSLSVVLSLALAIGVLAAMVNLHHQLLIKPLPYPAQQQLYLLKGDSLREGEVDLKGVVPYSAILELYRNDSEHFATKGLVHFCFDVIRSIPDQAKVYTGYITPEYLALLQPPMALGRIFNSDEGLGAKTPVTVLSFGAWQKFFQQDPNVLGKTLRFGDVDFQIIGVTAADFIEPQLQSERRATQVWLPWDFGPLRPDERDGWGWLFADQYFVGLLKPDLQSQQVAVQLSAHVNSLFRQYTRDIPFFAKRSLSVELVNYRQAIVGDTHYITLLLLAGAVVLLLTALISISHLLLLRGLSQQQYMAIKSALGARPAHLFNALLAEVLLLLTAALFFAVAIAYGIIAVFKSVARDQLPRLAELQLSWQGLLLVSLGCALLLGGFSWLLSRQINYRTLHGLLQRSGKGVGIQLSSRRRGALLFIQVVLMAILLSSSLHILVQSWRKLVQPVGFAMENVYQIPLSIGSLREQPIVERKTNLHILRDRLLLHPKVFGASLAASYFPTSAEYVSHAFIAVDKHLRVQKQAVITAIDSHYLQVLQLPLVAGRNFSEQESRDSPARVIVNQTLAAELGADGQVVGRTFYWPDERATPFEVIGIVRDFSLPNRPEESRLFIPHTEAEYPGLILRLRTGENFTLEEMNRILEKTNVQFKAAGIVSMEQAYDRLVAPQRLSVAIAMVLAVLALLLGMLGIYSVHAYSVQLRRFELGIRMAIGARPIVLAVQLLKNNGIPLAVGLLVALPLLVCAAYWLDRSHFWVIGIVSIWMLVSLFIIALSVIASLIAIIPIIGKSASHALTGRQ
ncbi:MAG TPA: ABC transporter permease [Cellvibrio sp.]|nr:ABC transporter permease [Cellvibrio sp.]